MIRTIFLCGLGLLALAGAVVPFLSQTAALPGRDGPATRQGTAMAIAPAGRTDTITGDAIASYLRTNPEVVVEALKLYQERQEAQRREKMEQVFISNLKEFSETGGVHMAGRPDAKITLIEFFDYNCGFCRRGLDTVLSIMEDSNDVRVLFVEFPILSSESEVAARASLASASQGKYVEFHTKLMQLDDRVTVDSLFEVAREIGLDIDKLTQEMNSAEIAARIDFNREVAASLEIRSTPTFFISNGRKDFSRLIAGFSGDDELRRAVAEARKLAARS